MTTFLYLLGSEHTSSAAVYCFSTPTACTGQLSKLTSPPQDPTEPPTWTLPAPTLALSHANSQSRVVVLGTRLAHIYVPVAFSPASNIESIVIRNGARATYAEAASVITRWNTNPARLPYSKSLAPFLHILKVSIGDGVKGGIVTAGAVGRGGSGKKKKKKKRRRRRKRKGHSAEESSSTGGSQQGAPTRRES